MLYKKQYLYKQNLHHMMTLDSDIVAGRLASDF